MVGGRRRVRVIDPNTSTATYLNAKLNDEIYMKQPTGFEIQPSEEIENIIKRYCMESCNPANTPMATTAALQADKNHQLSNVDHALYRSIVGSLMYVATCTRPNVSFAVRELRCFAHQPTQAHLTAAKRVIRTLKGTKHYKINHVWHTRHDESPKLVGYVDADFASDIDTRISVSSDYVFTFDG